VHLLRLVWPPVRWMSSKTAQRGFNDFEMALDCWGLAFFSALVLKEMSELEFDRAMLG